MNVTVTAVPVHIVYAIECEECGVIGMAEADQTDDMAIGHLNDVHGMEVK